MNTQTAHLPRRITVSRVLSSRYSPGTKPLSWDDREHGVDVVATTDGEELALASSGQQSTPAPGWELLLIKIAEVDDASQPGKLHTWTLYGLGTSAKSKPI